MQTLRTILFFGIVPVPRSTQTTAHTNMPVKMRKPPMSIVQPASPSIPATIGASGGAGAAAAAAVAALSSAAAAAVPLPAVPLPETAALPLTAAAEALATRRRSQWSSPSNASIELPSCMVPPPCAASRSCRCSSDRTQRNTREREDVWLVASLMSVPLCVCS